MERFLVAHSATSVLNTYYMNEFLCLDCVMETEAEEKGRIGRRRGGKGRIGGRRRGEEGGEGGIGIGLGCCF